MFIFEIISVPYLILSLFLTLVLIDLSISDLRSFTIPNRDNLLLLFAGLLRLSLCPSEELLSHILGFFILSVPLFFAALLKKGCLGGGDIKLLGTVGLYLGSPGILYASFLGFLLAAFYGVFLLLSKKKSPGDHIPMGPFLSAGIILSLIFVR